MEQEKKILLATDDLYTYMVEGWGSPEKFLEFFNNEREKEGEASIEDWTDKRVQGCLILKLKLTLTILETTLEIGVYLLLQTSGFGTGDAMEDNTAS